MSDDHGFIANELRMTCADAIELMTDYLDNAMSRGDLADFETHLTQCEGCRVYLDQLRKTITVTAETRDATVAIIPANFDELATLFARHASDPDI
jgi:predicted anti-sigma-YlaC factor YlaD